MSLEEIADRLLGFMPQRSVFWAAVGTFLVSISIQYVYKWLDKVTKLPWMREENQMAREQILHRSKNNQTK